MHTPTFLTALGLVLVALPLAKTSPITLEARDSNIVICIYRMSGTYGAFTRWVYGASLLCATLFGHHEWIAKGLMAWVMLYSSAAVAHLWVILCDSGLNPKVVDFDILPIVTIIFATFFLTAASIFCSTTVRSTKADAIIKLWSWWLLLGMVPAFTMLSLYYSNLRAAPFTEAFCRLDDSHKGSNEFAPSRFSTRPNDLSCTYDCFAHHHSRIRNAEEIFVISQDVLYRPVLRTLIIICGTWWIAMFFLSCVFNRFNSGCFKSRFGEELSKSKLLQTTWSIINTLPGLLAVSIGEGFMLRSDEILKTESFKGVGQWSAFIGVFFVIIVSLLDRYLFEPRRRAGKVSMLSFLDLLKMCLGRRTKGKVSLDDVEVADSVRCSRTSSGNALVDASLVVKEGGKGIYPLEESLEAPASNQGCPRRHSR